MVGHSSGGYTATALAEQRPDLVTVLALVNTGPHPQALFQTAETAVEPSGWPPTEEQIRQMAGQGFSRPGFQPPQHMLDDLRAMTYHTFTATMRASGTYIGQRPVPDRLAPLGIPLLAIYGADDRRWRPACYADYGVVPGARIEVLPGIGHSPNMEDPQRVATSLLAFAAAHATTAGWDVAPIAGQLLVDGAQVGVVGSSRRLESRGGCRVRVPAG